MIICTTITSLQQQLAIFKKQGQSIGFVPTMGALHKGHISLITQAKEKTNITVASIFVNPAQFNDAADFEKYPITLENDIFLLEQAGCDFLFLPIVHEIYPNGLKAAAKTYELGYIETVFEGPTRPGHFQGVCLVVEKLLNIVQPDILFLGQKDYQQCMVISQLLSLMNNKITTQLMIGTTVREANGLAMSSRNMRLSEKGKEIAASIYKTLQHVAQNINHPSIANIIQEQKEYLLSVGFSAIDYFSVANAKTLEPIKKNDASLPKVILFAGFLEGVRLIDNYLPQ